MEEVRMPSYAEIRAQVLVKIAATYRPFDRADPAGLLQILTHLAVVADPQGVINLWPAHDMTVDGDDIETFVDTFGATFADEIAQLRAELVRQRTAWLATGTSQAMVDRRVTADVWTEFICAQPPLEPA
jgi:hypothetical protein